jgi:hypothetical protein
VKSSEFQTIGIASAVILLSTVGFCIPGTATQQSATGKEVVHPLSSYLYDTYIRCAENTVNFDLALQDWDVFFRVLKMLRVVGFSVR